MTEIILTSPKNFMAAWRARRAIPAHWQTIERQALGMGLIEVDEAGAPYIEASGRTPKEALGDLERRLGAAWLAVQAVEEFEVEVGTPPSSIRKTFVFTLEEVRAVVAATHGGVEVDNATKKLSTEVFRRLIEFSQGR